MRSEKQMMDLLLTFAKDHPAIRVVGMEDSRTNQNVPRDKYQDYDITYIVTDPTLFTKEEDWLNVFGQRLMTQKPEDMELFPPTPNWWYSYLMLFEDGNKIDLTIVPLEDLERYLAHDKLLTVLLDKDDRVASLPVPTDEAYHVIPPTERSFDDCQNEFWFVSTYISKGLCRGEFLFATHHFTEILQQELLRMLSWWVGIQTEFSVSVGKSYKYLEHYLSKEDWSTLQSTFRLDSEEHIWNSLFAAFSLMRTTANKVAEDFQFSYPYYDKNITAYTEGMYQEWKGEQGELS